MRHSFFSHGAANGDKADTNTFEKVLQLLTTWTTPPHSFKEATSTPIMYAPQNPDPLPEKPGLSTDGPWEPLGMAWVSVWGQWEYMQTHGGPCSSH